MGNSKCDICDSVDIRILDNTREPVLQKCRNCGFVFKKGKTLFYDQLCEMPYNIDFNRSKEVKEIISVIRYFFEDLSGLNLVEIGCGHGVLMNEFRKYGFNVFGFEPFKSAVRMAKDKFNITTIREGYFEGNNLNLSCVPHVFLLYDVIEHMSDPLSILHNISNSMSSTTILIIKTGNPESLNSMLYPMRWSYYLGNQHISFYSKTALTILANKANLNLIKFYAFKHAYGGYALKHILKNIAKAILLRLFGTNTSYFKDFGIALANDHFIAVLKKKAV